MNEEKINLLRSVKEHFLTLDALQTCERLPDEFQTSYPLMSSKLDTPEKIHLLYEFIKFCNDRFRLDYNVYELAQIVEEVIQAHEIYGKNYVEIRQTFSGSKFYMQDGMPEALAFYTQGPAWDLRVLLFPGLKRSGLTNNELRFEWDEEESKK